MKLRFRFLAALLALVAPLTFTAQGAWAASCAGQMGSETGAVSSLDAAAPGTTCMAGRDMVPAGDSGQGDGNDSGAPHCPTMPMGATGACGAAFALPADSSPEIGLSVLEARPSISPDDVRDLLLAADFFRPPIA
ncbi:MAG: hypothetical protein ACREKN_03565 [Longimicrobiaceae bacterium]